MDFRNLPRAPEAAPMGHNLLGEMPTWNLGDLYPANDSPELKADLSAAQAESKAFEADYKGKLDALAKSGKLVEAIKRYEALSDVTGKLGSYAFLQYVRNTQDPDKVKFMGDLSQALTDLSIGLIFFGLELNRIDEATLDEAFAADASLARYRPWFDELRKAKPYQLDERIEELFHEKSVTGASAWNRLFDETMASLKFNVLGEELNLESTLNYLTDRDETKREAAFAGISKTLHGNERLFTHITNVLAKDKEISDRWHGFKDIADSRHLENSVEREVVDALQTAVREAYPRLSHRYYKMKAKWFGKEQLNAWDRNAPLPTSDDRIYDWQSAKDTVLEAYGKFSPKLVEIAEPFFERGWIDAPTRDGKSPGAFAHPTVPSSHPYLMLNYLGKARDVMTLAHELGHGVHQVLAGKQGALMAPTPADAGRDRLGVRRDAHLPLDAGQHHRPEAALRHAVEQGRGHAEHRGPADRLLHLRARGSHRPQAGRADHARPQPHLAGGLGRKPRPGDQAERGLRSVLGLHPALHPLAVLRLRLRLRRLSCELALRTV
jgi:oligoendopeptidase F